MTLRNNTVVADASPLIAFARIKLLSLLCDALGHIIIPQSVANECVTGTLRLGAYEIQQAMQEKVITVHQDPNPEKSHIFLDILGAGESAAISLALKLKAGLLIDDKMGRNIARKLDLKVIGTAGVLLLAKKKSLIQKVAPFIQDLKKAGYYLSTELISEILK